ncbi:hypothetical protein [Neptunicella sp. SCSIO 80796]|uniref:hypothetical protein n=1 Tax=Neptunicella plasticusilytica TaxID=3117012 RepID=UPI003A4DCED1
MLYPFICPTHRQWLTLNIHAATSHYTQCIDTAQYHIEAGCWQSALPFCGSAYETSEIIMTAETQDAISAVINFTHAAILLANGFRQLNMLTERQQVFASSRERLRLELQKSSMDSAAHTALLECYASLDLGYQSGLIHNNTRGDTDVSMQNRTSAYHFH